ncbi:ABC transporter ATP-binding protein [Cryptosporangium sp. NPDC048952]|uniref:ABC transporter ATP-binding protein n=1 Tax=Cryptosporangium sp. NPDC048952 TaxID=3363961 RepID=UPI00371B264A
MTESVLPELRVMWWESGDRARAETGAFTLIAGLPGLVAQAVRVSWRADRLRTTVIAASAVVSGAMATFGLLATQQILVELFASGPTPDRLRAAIPALAALGVATAIRALLTVATGYAQNSLTPRVNHEVEQGLFAVTTAVPLEAFDEDAFADDMERATRNSSSVIDLVEVSFDLLAGVIGIVAVAVAIVVIHPLLLIALVVATVPRLWASLHTGRVRYLTFLASSVRRRRLRILHDLMAQRDSAPELRAYRLRTFLLGLHDDVMGAETRIQLAMARRISTTQSVGSFTGGLATAAVYVLLGFLLLRGHIPLAAAATCVVALQAAQRTLTTTVYQIDRVYSEGQLFRDYVHFLDRAADFAPASLPDRLPDPLSRLDIDAVSLRYPGREELALDEVSLTVEAGQTVAFVGENGSGKSTLAALIAGLRAPSSGEIRWNGRRSTGDNPRIAVVTQDSYKWPFTAETNIHLGDVRFDPEQERVEEAARRAAAHEMIAGLPFGYRTLLDRTFANGQDLSGGQWQRITAARGFYSSPDLLIMDEPSSALDPRAEDALFQAIRDRQGETTTILITHRLANVRHADRIYVLHEGRLVETGTHEELMSVDGGRYAELFSLQAAGYTSLGGDH